MSPNKNIINLTFNPESMSAGIMTPSTSAEPKRIYPRSIKQQQNNSPRTFQNSFDSHSSICSTPRHTNTGGGNNRLTRNYSSLSCQSSPGIDYSPRYTYLILLKSNKQNSLLFYHFLINISKFLL